MNTNSNFDRTPSETEILACIDAFDRAIDHIVEWHKPGNISGADIADFKANITSLIRNGGTPADYFEVIAHGAFKECYEGLGDWVIKFASLHNATAAEKQLLDAARDAGLSWMFSHTLFIDLPRNLRTTMLEEADYTCIHDESLGECPHNCSICQWNVTEENNPLAYILNTVELQPRGYAASDNDYISLPYWEADYNKNPIYYQDGSVVPHRILSDIGIVSQNWAEDFINTYGDTNFHKFIAFADKFQLSDLHAANTGYVKTAAGTMPILLDWLSNL
jgi:hypothetical protein